MLKVNKPKLENLIQRVQKTRQRFDVLARHTALPDETAMWARNVILLDEVLVILTGLYESI